jgi:3-hydroxyacyl-[acyl-carrier-protein] dehydratase
MKFRLLDKITSWAPYAHISGVKTVSFEEYCLKEAFGETARLPESLLLESFLQLGTWLIILSSEFRQMGMVARISEVRFHGALLPGGRLSLDARLVRRHEDGFELAGEGLVEGKSIISGLGCLAFPVPLAEYADPADMRVLVSEIYSPLGAPAPSPARCCSAQIPNQPGGSPRPTSQHAGEGAGAPGV